MIIYKIINTINNKIYIGQHKGNRRSYFGGGKLLKEAINKYGRENFQKEIILDIDCDQKTIDDLEKYYIRLYNSTDTSIGYNIQVGGRGIKPINITDHFIETLRRRMIGNKIMLGRKRDEESKIKQSKTWSGILLSRTQEQIDDMSAKAVKTRMERYNFGKLISEGRQKNKKLDWNNKQTKPVVQETKDGCFVKLWASAYQVQKSIGYSSSCISNVCRNKQGCKTYKGFVWKFVTSE